jgi:hypothetical protein
MSISINRPEREKDKIFINFLASEASLSTPFIGGEPVSVANYP